MKNETIVIHSWQDMQQFGVNALTGEACAYALRLLCDLNEDGAALMLDYLGVTMLQKNWNSTVNNKPAVASVMLHRNSLLEVAEFALMRMRPLAIVYRATEGIMGIYSANMVDEYRKLVENWPSTIKGMGWTMRTIVHTSQPHEGSRNVHAFTGRTE